jgi:hypothetical protein
VRVTVEPRGSRTFDDELSSLRLEPPQFRTRLRGTATLTIDHPKAGAPKVGDVDVGLAFSEDRRTVVVEDFTPIVASDGTTITQIGGGQGTFDPATGAMALSVQLRFAVGGLVGAPDITFDLTTGRADRGVFDETGTALDRATGAIRLVAVGTFDNSLVLGGHDALVEIDGALDPIP